MFSDNYRRNRLLGGIIMLVAGIIFLVAPYYSMNTIVRYVGWIVMIGAVLNLVSCISGGFSGIDSPLVSSVLAALVALWLIRSPGSVVTSINLVFGIILLVTAGVSLLQCLQSSFKNPLTILLSAIGILFALGIIANPFRLTNMIIRLIGVGLIYQGAIRLLFENGNGLFNSRR